MLALTRKIGESITVDGGIIFTILKIQAGRVKVGVQAPSEIKISRTEVISDNQQQGTANEQQSE